MEEIVKEFYMALNYYGYSNEEADNIFKALTIKYADLSEEEFKEVLYNSMTSCAEEANLTIRERLVHIDGMWYASRKYAKYRSKIKDLSVDDLVTVMKNALINEQGDFLTEEEKELMEIGIISNCILIEEVEKTYQKRL